MFRTFSRLGIAIVLVLGLFLVAVNVARGKTTKFPLDVSWPELQILACLESEPAVSLSTLMSKDKSEETNELYAKSSAEGKCGWLVRVMVVYKKQVSRIEANNKLYAVYEATTNGVTIFVIMEDWEHNTIEA